MLVGFGFDRQGSGAGKGQGYTGLPHRPEYGIDIATWLDLTRREQELWIQDVNRSKDQANYFEDSLQRDAFDYVNYIDDKREDLSDIKDSALGAVGYGFDSLILLGLGIALLGRK